MASCLQKLLRKPPPSRLITSLHTQRLPNLSTSPLLTHQTHIGTKPDHHHHSPPTTDKFTHFNSSLFFPSFPFGFFLDPILSSGSLRYDPDDGVLNDGSENGMVWADSVKKKRKKKMNKHKYKKLRKRIRRQT